MTIKLKAPGIIHPCEAERKRWPGKKTAHHASDRPVKIYHIKWSKRLLLWHMFPHEDHSATSNTGVRTTTKGVLRLLLVVHGHRRRRPTVVLLYSSRTASQSVRRQGHIIKQAASGAATIFLGDVSSTTSRSHQVALVSLLVFSDGSFSGGVAALAGRQDRRGIQRCCSTTPFMRVRRPRHALPTHSWATTTVKDGLRPIIDIIRVSTPTCALLGWREGGGGAAHRRVPACVVS